MLRGAVVNNVVDRRGGGENNDPTHHEIVETDARRLKLSYKRESSWRERMLFAPMTSNHLHEKQSQLHQTKPGFVITMIRHTETPTDLAGIESDIV